MRHSVEQMLDRIATHWPEYDTPVNQTAVCLLRLRDIFIDGGKAKLHDLGLTQGSFEVLSTLRSMPAPREATPTELFRSILVTSGGMTKLLHQLEDQGLIKRIENEEDRRSKLVRLTDKGAEMAEVAMKEVENSDRQILFNALSEEEINTLSTVLVNAVTKIEQQR